MTTLARLSKSEAQLLDKLEAIRDQPVGKIFPIDMPAREIVTWSRAIVSWHEKTDGEQAAKIHMLGCLHARARANPAVLKEADCKTIDEYEDKIFGGKKHISTIYKISSSYLAYPDLTPQDIIDIGTTNLVVATKLAGQTKDLSPRQRKEIVQQAKKSVAEFKEWAEVDSGLSHRGALTLAEFKILGSQAEVDELREWLADKRFIQAASSNSPIMMILAAIQSWSAEWAPEETPEPAAPTPEKEPEWV